MAIDSISAFKDQAKPFSSRSDQLFGALYGRGDVAPQASDDAWRAAMLDVEAALAQACASEGLVPADAAETIAAACERDRFDLLGGPIEQYAVAAIDDQRDPRFGERPGACKPQPLARCADNGFSTANSQIHTFLPAAVP